MTTMSTWLVFCLLGLVWAAPPQDLQLDLEGNNDMPKGQLEFLNLTNTVTLDRSADVDETASDPLNTAPPQDIEKDVGEDISKYIGQFGLEQEDDLTLDRSAVVDNTASDPLDAQIKINKPRYADKISDDTCVRDFFPPYSRFGESAIGASLGAFVPMADNDPDTVVDVSIRFWPTYETYVAYGIDGVKRWTQSIVDKTNQIFQDSGVKIHLTTPCVTKYNWVLPYNRITYHDLLEYVRCKPALRVGGDWNCQKSDIIMQNNDLSVILLKSERNMKNSNGIIGMSDAFSVFEGRSQMIISKDGYPDWLLAHEIGHHMGLHHSSSESLIPYAESVYSSLMRHTGGWGGDYMRFSSSAEGQYGDEEHDNVRALNRFRFVLARSGNERDSRIKCY